MQVKLTVPSKTFLVGEYAVLDGGEALLVATEPRFEATVFTPGEGRLENIHHNSPAGLWARSNKEVFQQIDFRFLDPHEGRGGFGASSAQFLLTWVWNQLESTPFSKLSEGVDVEKILQDFLSLFEKQKGRPSGADVVAQCTGGLAQLKMSPFSVQQKKWSFEDMDFLIVPTGNKVSTHEHLNRLNNDGLSELKDLATQACAALNNKNKTAFLKTIQDYACTLKVQNKLTALTSELLQIWSSKDGVLAAKGCGALGADSFVLFVEGEKSLDIRNQLENSGLPVLASALSISPGLGMQLDIQGEVKSVSIKTPDGLVK